MHEVSIELNTAEQRLARYLAECRYRINRKQGIPDGKICDASNAQVEIEGVGAELAFCKLFNLYPDLEIGVRPDSDAIMHNGRTVDIKATRYANGHLIAAKNKINKPPDYYCLFVGEFPSYRFAGFMSAGDLLQEQRLADFGYGPTYKAAQDELTVFPR